MSESLITAAEVRQLLEANGFTVFCDIETKRPFCTITIDGHVEHWPIDSGKVRGYISQYIRKNDRRAMSSYVLDQAIDQIQMEANYDSPKLKTAVRVAQSDGDFLYDLADEHGQCVRTQNGRWTTESNTYAFRRYNHTQPQVTPDQDGSLEELCKFLNLPSRYSLLLMTYLVAGFVPEISHPLLLITGMKGSAKTTFTRILRALIDPSTAGHTSLRQKVDDFTILASQQWCVCFDNADKISPNMSDILCKAVTGDSYSKRSLYTNDELTTMSFKRIVLMNGIFVPILRTDLLDRTIWLQLPEIGPKDRRTDADVMTEFKKQKPTILGGIFNALSKAMSILPTLTQENLDRMADFDLWGRAIAVALGHTETEFMDALKENRRQIMRYTVTQHPVAIAVLSLMEQQPGGRWEGSATELLGRLSRIAHLFTRMESAWPKNAAALSQRLTEIKPELLEAGIHFDRGHNGNERHVTLTVVRDENSTTLLEGTEETGGLASA